MKIDEADYTVFDFETTGLSPYAGDRICEIGALRFTPHAPETKTFHALVDPQRPIAPGASRVNGITDRMVRGKPPIDEILPAFLTFIDGSVLVAYNAGFDLGFLAAALGERRALLDRHYVIDALGLARRLFPQAGRYSLTYLATTLGIDTTGGHRALADAAITRRVFERELTILRNHGATTITDIERCALPAGKRTPADTAAACIIDRAIRERKTVQIVYRSVWNDTPSERIITPTALTTGSDRVYVIAHCHLRNEKRVFRLDGIVEAALSDAAPAPLQ